MYILVHRMKNYEAKSGNSVKVTLHIFNSIEPLNPDVTTLLSSTVQCLLKDHIMMLKPLITHQLLHGLTDIAQVMCISLLSFSFLSLKTQTKRGSAPAEITPPTMAGPCVWALSNISFLLSKAWAKALGQVGCSAFEIIMWSVSPTMPHF